MGKLENFNQDATLDISKPMISRSLVEVPQSSRYWYFTVYTCMYDVTAWQFSELIFCSKCKSAE